MNRLKECKGYEEIYKDRVSAGSSNKKKWVIKGIAFIEEDDSVFDDVEQQSLIE